MMPLHGFLQGDVIGLLVLADEHETVAALAERLQAAAAVRVAPFRPCRVVHRGRTLDPRLTLIGAGISALDRFDVVREAPSEISQGEFLG